MSVFPPRESSKLSSITLSTNCDNSNSSSISTRLVQPNIDEKTTLDHQLDKSESLVVENSITERENMNKTLNIGNLDSTNHITNIDDNLNCSINSNNLNNSMTNRSIISSEGNQKTDHSPGNSPLSPPIDFSCYLGGTWGDIDTCAPLNTNNFVTNELSSSAERLEMNNSNSNSDKPDTKKLISEDKINTPPNSEKTNTSNKAVKKTKESSNLLKLPLPKSTSSRSRFNPGSNQVCFGAERDKIKAIKKRRHRSKSNNQSSKMKLNLNDSSTNTTKVTPYKKFQNEYESSNDSVAESDFSEQWRQAEKEERRKAKISKRLRARAAEARKLVPSQSASSSSVIPDKTSIKASCEITDANMKTLDSIHKIDTLKASFENAPLENAALNYDSAIIDECKDIIDSELIDDIDNDLNSEDEDFDTSSDSDSSSTSESSYTSSILSKDLNSEAYNDSSVRGTGEYTPKFENNDAVEKPH